MDGSAVRDGTAETEGGIQLVPDGIRHLQPEIPGRRHGYVDGLLRDASGRDPAHRLPMYPVIARLQIVPPGRGRCIPLPPDIAAHEGQGPDRHGVRKTVLDPGMGPGRVLRKVGTVGQIPVRKHFHCKSATAGSHLGAQFGERFFRFREPDGHDRHVLIPGCHLRSHREYIFRNCILKLADGREWLRQRNLPRLFHLRIPGHFYGAPGKFFHRVLRLDPGPAGGAPAGRGGDGDFHPELIGIPDGVPEGILPTLLHVRLPLHDRLHAHHQVPTRVELLHPGDAGGFHPIQICLDALLRDIPVHPVPPDPGPGFLGRVLEIIIITLRRGSYGKKQRPCQGDS